MFNWFRRKKNKVIASGGIFTTDPTICSEARLIKEIGYEEMMELVGSSGGKPINARAIELAMINNVPILYTSIENYPQGTKIGDY